MSDYTLTFKELPTVEHQKGSMGVPPVMDDAVCFSRFLDGDDAAFAELFDRHNHRLYIYALKFLRSPELAEDVTQELWERVIRLRLAPQEVRNPVGFFLKIARNLCINAQKRGRRFSPLADLPESEHPHEREEPRSELQEAVEVGLERLSFEYREVLILNIYCGYRFDEIATILGKSSGTIWVRASRARGKLRKIVTEIVGAQKVRDMLQEKKQ